MKQFDVLEVETRFARAGPMNPELEASIRATGVVQPIILATYDPGKLIVGDGNDRVRICRKLVQEGMEERRFIPGVIDASLDEAAVLRMIVETEKRSSRNPVDIGRYLLAFQQSPKLLTQKAVAEATGISESTVCRCLMPFSYGEEIVALVASERLSLSHLAVVNPLKDISKQSVVLKQAAERGLTAAATKLLAFPPKPPRPLSKYHTIVEGGLKVTLPLSMTFAEFAELSAKIGERLRANVKDFDKSRLPVAQIDHPK